MARRMLDSWQMGVVTLCCTCAGSVLSAVCPYYVCKPLHYTDSGSQAQTAAGRSSVSNRSTYLWGSPQVHGAQGFKRNLSRPVAVADKQPWRRVAETGGRDPTASPRWVLVWRSGGWDVSESSCMCVLYFHFIVVLRKITSEVPPVWQAGSVDSSPRMTEPATSCCTATNKTTSGRV